MIDHHFTGQHIIADFYGVSKEFLVSSQNFIHIYQKAILESNATLCALLIKDFEPSGFTILGLLSESHSSVHTYPEHESVFIDAFTCGTHCSPLRIIQTLEVALEPKRASITSVLRGRPEQPISNIDGYATLRAPEYA
ncbi:adenosylmethionine decarboxylase [Brucella sp. NBRC 12950]|uniref:adenosylmethionine decarboxylase n=1 Tax=Brucella sp. NBRC 12950 TaxID=2994518 RepID=UPI0024A3B0A8|nr:adenosylmethionine decarboxylase [Brucella sp. NBRC 12950]GLU27922.1 S-adenosylmethionine decarboxylase proenzyme [Brucella sp. NBRC 12950]